MENLSNFVRLAIAKISGHDAEATALKIERKAIAALASQIAVQEALVIDYEQAVEDAEEKLDEARINSGNLIEDRDWYVQSIVDAHEFLEDSKKQLADLKEIIKFLKSELSNIKKK